MSQMSKNTSPSGSEWYPWIAMVMLAVGFVILLATLARY